MLTDDNLSPSPNISLLVCQVICSAMGKTTDCLVAAGQTALAGRVVDIEAIRDLHLGTCRDLGLPDATASEVERLLDECQDVLNEVILVEVLSPKSLDRLLSYGERLSVRILAARLNQLGVPSRAFDAWDVGVLTDDNHGNAKLLPSAMESIRDRFDGIDPNVVAVVTGFIGKCSRTFLVQILLCSFLLISTQLNNCATKQDTARRA